jgi:hypothetical protein
MLIGHPLRGKNLLWGVIKLQCRNNGKTRILLLKNLAHLKEKIHL